MVRETGADVASTVFFDKGEIEIKNGAAEKPTAYLAASFDELSEEQAKALFDSAFVPLVVVAGAVAEYAQGVSDLVDA